jgi:acid stress-induced BolA-like protein IbaG/YrbA
MIHNRDRALGSRVFYGYTARPEYYVQKPIHMDPTEIAQLIEAGLPGATAQVMSDDNTHFGALVVAAEFEGKRSLARHQLVYKCLGTLVGQEIHALSITALTPDEWRDRRGGAQD